MSLTRHRAGSVHGVSPDVLDAILSPYKAHCRYLQSASIEAPAASEANAPGTAIVSAHGRFQIPESWYIRDTGHFNSIEFNICYNQLVYTLIGQSILSGLVPELATMTFAEYLERQLPDVLIARFSSAFKRPMDSQNFDGTVSLVSVKRGQGLMLLKTRCSFSGSDGGYSEGDVTLTIVEHDAPGSVNGARP